jgi:NAD(P)-dependent dehydrogenase (short-subunit alcohol dehydrogenase family)
MKQVAFITGASSGIGYALAVELAQKGYSLALAARRKDLLEELAHGLKSTGVTIATIACDVGDQAQIKEAIAETVRQLGGIDLAILSAGVSEPTDAVNFTASKFERLARTNLLGVAYCLEELIPIMKKPRSGGSGATIAVISSLAGDRGMPGSSGYCATKAAVSALFDGMRPELRRHGIRLVTIEPGYVQTPMTDGIGRMPFLMQADDAARLILTRIERGDRVIRFPFVPAAFMKVMRVLPVRIFDAVIATLRPKRPDRGTIAE